MKRKLNNEVKGKTTQKEERKKNIEKTMEHIILKE